MKKNNEAKTPKTKTTKKTLNFPLPQDEFKQLMDSKKEEAQSQAKNSEVNSNIIYIDFKNKKRLA